jgi:hypothetical protein
MIDNSELDNLDDEEMLALSTEAMPGVSEVWAARALKDRQDADQAAQDLKAAKARLSDYEDSPEILRGAVDYGSADDSGEYAMSTVPAFTKAARGEKKSVESKDVKTDTATSSGNRKILRSAPKFA